MSQPDDDNKPKPWTPPPFKAVQKSAPPTDSKSLLGGAELIGGGFKPASVGHRLKNLRKEEMAFLLAGLPLLFLAPLIEHLVMSPKKGKGGPSLQQQEFNFPETGDPVERGILNMAAGGVLGQKPNVRPLDAPDPLKFIVTGDIDDQQPNQTITPEPVRKEKKQSSDWETALAAASKPAVAQVSRSAGLPRPAGKLTTSLTAIASGGGGSKAAATGANMPTTPGGGGGGRGGFKAARTQAAPDIKGNRERSQSAGTGAPTGLLNRAVDVFKMGGGSPTGSGGMDFVVPPSRGGVSVNAGGQPASGEEIKMPGATAAKDAKTQTNAGESLSQQLQKERAMKQIALEFDKKRYNQIERKKMLEQIAAQTASQAALKAEEKLLDALLKTGEQGQGGGGGGGDGGGQGGGGGNPLSAAEGAAGRSATSGGEIFSQGRVASLSAGRARQILDSNQQLTEAETARLAERAAADDAKRAEETKGAETESTTPTQ